MNAIRYAVVGLKHGASHVHHALENSRIELAAVCDLDDTLLAPYRRRGVACFNQFEQMLQEVELDAVVIATPIPLHVPMARKVLASGRHLFLEKPVGSNLQEVLELQRMASEYPNQKIQIGFEYRSSPLAQALKSHIDKGDIGRLHHVVWTTYQIKVYPPEQRWKIKRNAGGPLFDECSHFYSLWNYFLQSKFTRACAFGGINHFDDAGREVEDNGVVIFDYENGARAMLGFAEFVDQPHYTHFDLIGSAGKIHVDPINAGEYVMYNGAHQRSEFDIDPSNTCPGHLGFGEQHDQFVDSIVNDTETIAPLSAGIETYLMGLAATTSIARQSVVTREEVLESTGPVARALVNLNS